MSDSERKGPTRWQAKVWTDTVLQLIVGGEWFGASDMARSAYSANAIQIGQYFPGFGGAYDSWRKNPNSFNQQVLQQEAEKVILSLPIPYEQPDIQYEMDAAEETIVQQLEYIRLLEDLIEDYDAIGWFNVCKCGPSYLESDSRCCWVRRAWERLIAYRKAKLGGSYERMTKRPNEEHERITNELWASMDNEARADVLVRRAWPDGMKSLVKRLLDENDELTRGDK